MSLTDSEKVRVLKWVLHRCQVASIPGVTQTDVSYSRILHDCAAECEVGLSSLIMWDHDENFLPVKAFLSGFLPVIERLLVRYEKNQEDEKRPVMSRTLPEYLVQCYAERHSKLPYPLTDEEKQVVELLDPPSHLGLYDIIKILDYLYIHYGWIPANPVEYLEEYFAEDKTLPSEVVQFHELTDRHLTMIGDPGEGSFPAFLLLPYLRSCEREASLQAPPEPPGWYEDRSEPPVRYKDLTAHGKKEKEEKTVAKKIKDALVKTQSKLIPAAREGLNMSGAVMAKNVLVAEARKHAGENYPKFLDTPLGKKAEPLLLATAVHVACEMYPEQIPQAAGIARNCERIVTDEFRQSGGELLSYLLPFLKTLAAQLSEDKNPDERADE